MKKILAWLVILFATSLIAKGWWESQFAPVSSDQATQVFIVQKGESVSNIAGRLQSMGLIRSSLAFKIAFKLGREAIIEAGDFKLSPSMPVSKIITTMGKSSLDKWVTLLEGWRVEEMAEKINSEFRIQNSEFLKVAKEGYMFPDTYSFNKDATSSDIASIMKTTFNKRYSSDLQGKIGSKGLTAEQGVILASIVEREARSKEARTEVASILLKRFKIGMGLNADATIQYILGYQPTEKSWWKRHLTSEDLKTPSAYNTYLNAGLPPAPICNPGLSSLEAVANADPSTPYLYYYHDSKGNSYYAKTLEEHNQNVANYP